MSGTKVDYSLKEERKRVYAQCLASPEYFIMNFVYIQMSEGGRGKFDLFVFQKKLLHLLKSRDRLIILKSRQLGITTLSAAYALWLMIFKNDQSILALAPDQDKARQILDKISFSYDNLPALLLRMANAESVEKNKLRITLKNGSKAVAASGASKSARGKTATFLVLDEAAFIENAEELWGSAQQTLSTGGSAIVLSTPNGNSGFFFDLWEASESGDNEFVPVKLPWTVHPNRDQAWRDRQDAELGKRMAAQECDTSFSSSEDTYFESEDLQEFERDVLDPLEMRGPLADYWIWKHADYCGNCMAVVDTSRGDGADFSTITVIELDSMEEVAEYKGLLEPIDLAKKAVEVCLEYNSALLVIENTGVGFSTCSHAKQLGYVNIYYTPKDDSEETMMNVDIIDEEKMTIGFTTSTKTRDKVLSSLREARLDGSLKVRSRRAHSEFKTFIWKRGKPQAQSGRNDDILMSLAIGCYLRNTAIRFKTQGLEMQRAVLGGIVRTSYNTIYKPTAINNNPYMWTNPYDGTVEDISWLAR